jgi:hypothetical protein
MPKASLTFIDDYGRTTKRVYELESQVDIAAYVAAIAGLLTDIQAVSDLGCVRADLIIDGITSGFAVTSGANVDVGATFQGLIDGGNGKKASLKLPGIKAAMVNTDGSVDLADSDIIAYLANWETAGAYQLSDGETIASWVKGMLDK